MGGGPGLEPGEGEGARRFGHGAAVVEDVLDGGADGVVVDGDDLVQQVPAQAEGFGSGAAHGDAVAEQADLIQGHHLARLDRRLHGGGVDRLDADDPGAGSEEFDDGGDAGGQASAADGDEDGGDGFGVLAGDLQPDRALAGDDVGVVERVYEDGAGLRRAPGRLGEGLVEGVAMQDHVAAQRPHGGDLDGGRGDRHDDGRDRAALPRREGDTLGVVAGRGADDAARQLLRRQGGDLVVGAADLEREDRLQVLALLQHRPAEPGRKPGQGVQGRFDGDVVHAGRQDATKGFLHGEESEAERKGMTCQRAFREEQSSERALRPRRRDWPGPEPERPAGLEPDSTGVSKEC